MKCAIEVYQQELARMNETDEEYLNLWVDEPVDLPHMEKHYKQIVDRQSMSCDQFCSFTHAHAYPTLARKLQTHVSRKCATCFKVL